MRASPGDTQAGERVLAVMLLVVTWWALRRTSPAGSSPTPVEHADPVEHFKYVVGTSTSSGCPTGSGAPSRAVRRQASRKGYHHWASSSKRGRTCRWHVEAAVPGVDLVWLNCAFLPHGSVRTRRRASPGSPRQPPTPSTSGGSSTSCSTAAWIRGSLPTDPPRNRPDGGTSTSSTGCPALLRL